MTTSTSVRKFRGLPVHDAEKGITVELKRSDLVGGYTRLANYCAVHHALMREAHKKKDEVYVHNTTIYIKNTDHWVRYKMSVALRIQIAVHDQGGIMKEGEYKLLKAPKSVMFTENRRNYQRRDRKPTGKLRNPITTIGERDRPSYTHPTTEEE